MGLSEFVIVLKLPAHTFPNPRTNIHQASSFIGEGVGLSFSIGLLLTSISRGLPSLCFHCSFLAPSGRKTFVPRPSGIRAICDLLSLSGTLDSGSIQYHTLEYWIRKQQNPTVEHRSSTDLIGVPVSEIMVRLLRHSNRLNWMAGALEHGEIISTTARIPHWISCSTRFSTIVPHLPLLLCSSRFLGTSSFIAGTAVLLIGWILRQATCMGRADFYKGTKAVSLTWINQTAQAGSM